jgi:hypothetical protein
MRCALIPVALLAGCSTAPPSWQAPAGYDRVYGLDFATQGSLGSLHFSDPGAWAWKMDCDALVDDPQHGSWLEVERASDYQPPFRSPASIALIRDLELGDFMLWLEVKSTAPESRGAHRDLCFFFGFQDPAHFYYIHLAPGPDERAHNVFVVNGSDRRRVGEVAAEGIDWSEGWHKVRVERSLSTGSIRVFFDDMQQPVLDVVDHTFGWGRIGLGTFDDSGCFTNVSIYAPEARTPQQPDPFDTGR